MAREPATKGTGASGPVVLRDRFQLFPDKPLPDLDMPQARAYHCEDRRGQGRALYVLICRNDLPVRLGAMRSLKGVQTAGLLQLVEYGPVDWPPLGARTIAVVYQRPLGGRVMPEPGGRFTPVPEIQFAKKIIRPLLQAVTEMSQRGVMHRAIRLDNLYWFDQSKEKIVLGDCTTSPPGHDNPAVYEPLEYAMALPEGRGQGYTKDDLYALGITFIGLLNGMDPAKGWTTDAVIRAKLQQSTYAVWASDNRVPLNLLEVMRGLLCDDVRDRWDTESLDLWLNGRRMTPLQPQPAKRAQRGFKFEGKDYHTARELAHAMAANWDAAAGPIMDGRLEVWLRRGLEASDTADAVALAIRMAQAMQGDATAIADFAVARVLILLDPRAPLRYREISVRLDGFGTAMAVAAMQDRPLKPYSLILARDLAKHWIDAQGVFSPELSHFEGQFKELSGNLATNSIGWGIERCLYELSEHLPCLSPLIRGEYVTEIRDLLPALDRVAGRQNPKTRPMDRHIAAFIACKWQRDTHVQFRALNDSDPERSVLGMVSLLAVLQWRLGPPQLHGLCSWVGGQIAPIINSYHSRERRRELEKKVPQLIRKGSLPELYNVLDNQEERAKDSEGFAWARAEYSAAEQQIQALEQGRLVRDERAETQGQQSAAVISILIAVLTVTVLLFARIW